MRVTMMAARVTSVTRVTMTMTSFLGSLGVSKDLRKQSSLQQHRTRGSDVGLAKQA